jgi:hypothetical protein
MSRESKPQTSTLRRASSTVFALISVLPLLLFAYTLYALDALHHTMAQIGLGSALILSMIGFYIYSVMIARLSDILRELETEDSSAPPPAVQHGPVVTMAVEPSPGGHLAMGHAGGLVVPGMGRITELKPVDGAAALSDLDLMWKTEAEPLLGKRVLVALRNTPDPIKGVLSQVTDDGVILDRSGAKSAISYARVSAIEADTAPEPA